ncbi:MAG TPA: DUF2283 domain-containing protein [bacterium]|nr:DUF2283 domain-containing protein [bacterium]
MGQVKVFYDRAGNTLTVWFGDRQDEFVSEETGEEVVLMKDRAGRVIGFEKLNFVVPAPERLQVAFEAVGA